MILNFGSTELTEDSIIDQWHIQNRTIIMFGDDTWIKLFPHQFKRSDGTSSFFVADFTEVKRVIERTFIENYKCFEHQVDDNVTRHLAGEMPKNDWDVCILHYLGLEHIGHLAGPSSNWTVGHRSSLI